MARHSCAERPSAFIWIFERKRKLLRFQSKNALFPIFLIHISALCVARSSSSSSSRKRKEGLASSSCAAQAPPPQKERAGGGRPPPSFFRRREVWFWDRRRRRVKCNGMSRRTTLTDGCRMSTTMMPILSSSLFCRDRKVVGQNASSLSSRRRRIIVIIAEEEDDAIKTTR